MISLAKYKGLALVIFSLLLFGCGVFFIMIQLSENINFFYTPTELLEKKDHLQNRAFRVSGNINYNSIKQISDDTISFIISDQQTNLEVHHVGKVPAIFQENIDAVVQGTLGNNNIVQSTNVLMKHNEYYSKK